MGFTGGTSGKEPTNAGDIRTVGSASGWRRSPGGGRGNPLQYSCLENPMDRGAWWATVHGVVGSRTRLSNFTYLLTYTYAILVATFWRTSCSHCKVNAVF